MIEALSFLTIVGHGRTPTSASLRWFAPVGALIGALVGLTWWGASHWWPPLVAAGMAVLADLVLTGMLHLDGLADSADGLLAHMDRDRRLAVMAQPDVGAFGVGAVVLVLILRWSALAAMDPDGRTALTIAALWAVSRLVMVHTVRTSRYARAEGLASAFVSEAPLRIGVWAQLLAIAACGFWLGKHWQSLAAIAAAVIAGIALVVGARRRLGGFTGDVLGAAGMVGETVGLVVASAHW